MKKAFYWILRPQVVSGALLAFFFIPYCGFIFGCGCVQIWQGAHHACNAFHAGAPDCPFCIPPFCKNCGAALQSLLQVIPFAAAYIPGVLGIQVLRKWKGRLYLRDLAVGLAIMALCLLIVAFIYGKIANYPYFLRPLSNNSSDSEHSKH